jgi:hypothetical protein
MDMHGVNSVTGLTVGNYITIAGVSSTKKIVSISGLVVNIDVAANATVSSAAVAYATPTFSSSGIIDLQGSITWDPGSLADGGGETSPNITGIPNAALGDFVLVAAPYDLQGVTCTAYISSTNVVKIRLQNETGGTVDFASGLWKVKIIKS